MEAGRDSDMKRGQGVPSPPPHTASKVRALIEHTQLVQGEGVFAKTDKS